MWKLLHILQDVRCPSGRLDLGTQGDWPSGPHPRRVRASPVTHTASPHQRHRPSATLCRLATSCTGRRVRGRLCGQGAAQPLTPVCTCYTSPEPWPWRPCSGRPGTCRPPRTQPHWTQRFPKAWGKEGPLLTLHGVCLGNRQHSPWQPSSACQATWPPSGSTWTLAAQPPMKLAELSMCQRGSLGYGTGSTGWPGAAGDSIGHRADRGQGSVLAGGSGLCNTERARHSGSFVPPACLLCLLPTTGAGPASLPPHHQPRPWAGRNSGCVAWAPLWVTGQHRARPPCVSSALWAGWKLTARSQA